MFAVLLIALVIVPQQARRAAAAITTATPVRPDTEPSIASLAQAERRVAAAEAELAAARAQFARPSSTMPSQNPETPSGSDSSASHVHTHRDTLVNQVSQLGRLIARSENAPLLGSYRALAQAPPMQGDTKVRQLLDSLVEIERERDSYSAVGGVDPVFVALTARANELGRSIESLADARRTALKKEIETVTPAEPISIVALERLALPDTIALLSTRDIARAVTTTAATRLARDRAELQRQDERETRARELSNIGASPRAMLAAALVFGAAFGFGITLLSEVRHPRIANAREAERATGARVLGVIGPQIPSSEEERAGPIHIDPGAGGHQLIYQDIATAGVGTVMLTIAGDDPAVAAVVAINFSAIASDEARATLLIDTDFQSNAVMAALRLRPGAGVAELVRATASWVDVTRVAQLGGNRSIEVVPGGEGNPASQQVSALLQRDAARLTRHYDAIVLVSSLTQVADGTPVALPIPDVIYCARIGYTTIVDLKDAISAIRKTGANARGIVLWNGPEPILAQLRPTEDASSKIPALA